MLIDSARAFQTEGQVPSSPIDCVLVCVLCTCWIPEWHILTEQPLLPVCLPQVWHWYGLSAPSQRQVLHWRNKWIKHQQPGSEGSFRAWDLKTKARKMWIKAVGIPYATGGIKQRMQGQLNDPCSVARRHRGWMVEINAGIHPWQRAEGGKEGGWGEAEGKRGRV